MIDWIDGLARRVFARSIGEKFASNARKWKLPVELKEEGAYCNGRGNV